MERGASPERDDRAPAPAIELDQPLRQSFEIRRRRYGGRSVLVRHIDAFELNDVVDAVWRHTIEGRTFVEIIDAVVREARVGDGESRGAVAAAATAALEQLLSLGFVVPAGRHGDRDGSDQTGATNRNWSP